jgi:hypothetical protein
VAADERGAIELQLRRAAFADGPHLEAHAPTLDRAREDSAPISSRAARLEAAACRRLRSARLAAAVPLQERTWGLYRATRRIDTAGALR